MTVKGVTSRCWIIALFIRDDGQRLLLGDGAYQFVKKQQHFAANTVSNTTVDVQGNDGVLLAGQTIKAAKQAFDGYVGDAAMSREETEVYRRRFIAFFQNNHYYEVVYVFTDGSAIKRQRGFLVDAPAVKELYQIFPEYHVALNFEDVNYYDYREDESGNELYGQSANVLLYNAITGGFPWDKKGLVWDNLGAVCNPGMGGTTTLNINSIDYIYPIWTVNGPADNPVLENLTTGTKISYVGRVSPGQTLVIDMANQTATLNGSNVLPNVRGEWMNFAPGINRINYITDNDNATNSNLKWAEVVAS